MAKGLERSSVRLLKHAYELILEQGAVRWPCNEEHPLGTKRLYEDLRFWTGIDDCESFGFDFLTENHVTKTEYEKIDLQGKAFLRPARWRMQPNPPTEDFPFVISTGRVVYHFHTRTKTARSEELNRRVPHAYVEIHPDDAERLNISTGDTAEVVSPKAAGPGWRWSWILCARANCSSRSTSAWAVNRRINIPGMRETRLACNHS